MDSDHKTQGQRKGKGTERYYEMKRMREEYGGSTEGSKGKVEYVLYIELHNYNNCLFVFDLPEYNTSVLYYELIQ